MTPHTIADIIFWSCFASVAIFVYQGIILPGIRMSLRYRVFALRDQLRKLVIEGRIEENDNYMRVMEAAPDEVQKIFKESLNVIMLALTCNSLFIFVISATCLLVGITLKSSFRHVKELFWQKVDADTTVAFFSPELATV